MASSVTAVYGANQLSRYKNISVQGEITTSDDGNIPVLAGRAKHQIVIRRIVANLHTAAAETAQFEADGAGGDPVFTLGASLELGEHEINWGELGYALPEGEGLQIAITNSGGNGFTYVVEAYERTAPGAGTPAELLP
jgi:hypothetical protein